MTRSIWKNLFVDKCLLKEKKKNKVWSRRSSIPESLIGQKIFVYNGKEFKKIWITREKVGFKLGEFCFTRKQIPKTSKIKKK
jgi:ribosomal protein S19